ncbi:type IV toxin-antitoxin system AbiEi family antitoxin [Nocardia takedensis]|uniref:type IV toxin-antitoxin system AbiEi family antitoxin n=1 Tax=Nocardia takedensis TaxID=259390 RepID=UPI0012F6B55F|nr:type IV toxin-antitoxin system AbiEi family antitoxin [Nocardia takedensis]
MFNISLRSIILNRVYDRTRQEAIERSVSRALSDLGVDFEVRHWLNDDNAQVSVGRHGHHTPYRLVWSPHPTLSALTRSVSHNEAERLLVSGPRITSRTARAFREAGIDYIDDAGNAHLSFGPVLIDIQGRTPPTEPVRRPSDANLFSAKRMQVIFVLLAWPDLTREPVRSIATAARSSVGIVQSTLDILKEADYLLGRSLHRRNELLDLWVAAFRGSLLPKIRRHTFSGEFADWSPPPGYLLSGESAVDTIRHPRTLTIYTEDFDLRQAVRSGWQTSEEPNIEVRQKFWREPTGEYSRQQAPFGQPTVPPPLIYADLKLSNEPRQIEIATLLRKDRLV